MEIKASWKQDKEFTVLTNAGHSISVEGLTSNNKSSVGARPMELLLASLATCSGIDVVIILNKAKRKFDSIEILVSGERSSDVPAVFTDIHLQYEITGVDKNHAERAVKLSVEKYCSAIKMLENNSNITWSLK